MNKEYWYIENDEQKGPLNGSSLAKLQLSDSTMVWHEGLTDWVKYGDIKSEVDTNLFPSEEQPINSKRKKKKVFVIAASAILLITGLYVGFILFKRYSFTEEEAKEIVEYFVHSQRSKDIDESIYPNASKIGSMLHLVKDFKITSAYKDEKSGFYKVMVDYYVSDTKKYAFLFAVKKEKGVVKIEYTRGLNYFLYDGVVDYALALKLLNGNENDIEISEIVKKNDLKNFFEFAKSQELLVLRKFSLSGNVQITNVYFGSVSGTVTIMNESDYFLGREDLRVSVNFFDKNENLIDSRNVVFYTGGIPSRSSKSESFFFDGVNEKFRKYNVTFEIIQNQRLDKEIQENIIKKVMTKK